MHVTNDQFNNGWIKILNGRFIVIFHILTPIIWPCGRDNLKKNPCILFKYLLCMLLISSSWTSSIMAMKKIKMASLVRFVPFYFNNLTLWTRCGRNNNFKFNNGGRLLSNVLLFLIASVELFVTIFHSKLEFPASNDNKIFIFMKNRYWYLHYWSIRLPKYLLRTILSSLVIFLLI